METKNKVNYVTPEIEQHKFFMSEGILAGSGKLGDWSEEEAEFNNYNHNQQ